jgi:hypothetical protein
MHEDLDGYAEQVEFDDALEATGVFDEFEQPPTLIQIHSRLSLRRLEILGMSLCKSSTIPSLDQRCGEHLKFRDLIQCGETQARIGIPNLPLNPETYNALYSLSTQLLDPVIDYFGAIKITYGFCSPVLGSNIRSRIAPKLDQHASHECNKQGEPICDRLGSAVDFIIDDEDMTDVAKWIIENLTFDRIYLYGRTKPLHISFSETPSAQISLMLPSKSGKLIPRKTNKENYSTLVSKIINF